MNACDANGITRRLERLERRTAGVEEVTGVVLPGGDGLVDLLVSEYNADSETHTLKWRSQSYLFYRIERSADLVTWETEESMVQGASALATVFTISVPAEDAPVYFRVRALPISYSPCVLIDDVGDEEIPPGSSQWITALEVAATYATISGVAATYATLAALDALIARVTYLESLHSSPLTNIVGDDNNSTPVDDSGNPISDL